MRAVIWLVLICLAGMMAGCASPVPPRADRPCGVIIDSLIGVNATDRDGQRRLDQHFERGHDARCWGR